MVEQEGVGNMGLELSSTSAEALKESVNLLYMITGCSAHAVLMIYWLHRNLRKHIHHINHQKS